MPGVTAIAVTNAVPQGAISPFPQGINIQGEGQIDQSRLPQADQNIATADYFSILGVPMLAGRTFTDTDTKTTLPVAIINQTMATLWGRRNPIGTYFTVGTASAAGPAPEYTVVGIVGDVRQYSIDRPVIAEFYTPLQQIELATPNPVGLQVLLKTEGDAATLASGLRDAVRQVDPSMPVENIRTLEELHASKIKTPRLGAMLLAVFAGLALVITLAGLGAVIATTVSQRTREFGLRMALGASPGSVLAMVCTQGAWMVGVGLMLGIGGAVLAGRALQNYLYQTPSVSPVVYATVAGLFVVAGLVACWGPARRATSIDPLRALRAD
jgi:predicted permease